MEGLRERMRAVGNRYAYLHELLDKKYDEYWEYALTPEETLKLNDWYANLNYYLIQREVKEMMRCEYPAGSLR